MEIFQFLSQESFKLRSCMQMYYQRLSTKARTVGNEMSVSQILFTDLDEMSI